MFQIETNSTTFYDPGSLRNLFRFFCHFDRVFQNEMNWFLLLLLMLSRCYILVNMQTDDHTTVNCLRFNSKYSHIHTHSAFQFFFTRDFCRALCLEFHVKLICCPQFLDVDKWYAYALDTSTSVCAYLSLSVVWCECVCSSIFSFNFSHAIRSGN